MNSWNDYDEDDEHRASTAQELERRYDYEKCKLEHDPYGINEGRSSIAIQLNTNSRIKAMRRVIERHATDMSLLKFSVKWVGQQSDFTVSPEFVLLLEAIGGTPKIDHLHLEGSFAAADLLSVVKSLQQAEVNAEQLDLKCRSKQQANSQDEVDDFLDMLDQASQWQNLKKCNLNMDLCLGADLLEGLADYLPALNLTELFIQAKAPLDYCKKTEKGALLCPGPRGDIAVRDLELAIENNLYMKRFGVSFMVTDETKRNYVYGRPPCYEFTCLSNTGEFFCYLNTCGRKHLLAAPQHHESWLARLGDVNELLRGPRERPKTEDYDLELSTFYYYLRHNSWLFQPQEDLLGTIRTLRKRLAIKEAALEDTKKQHSAELKSTRKRMKKGHNAELLEVNNKRLVAELEAKKFEIQFLKGCK